MNNSKTILVSAITIALFSITLLSGCKKESTGSGTCSDGIKNQNETGVDCGGVCSVCNTTNQTGIVKVNLTVDLRDNTSSYVYTLDGPIKVTLRDNNYNTVATEYAGGTSTVDFGSFNHGTYSVYAEGKERKTSLSSGSTTINRTLSGSCTVNLNSTQNSCSISM